MFYFCSCLFIISLIIDPQALTHCKSDPFVFIYCKFIVGYNICYGITVYSNLILGLEEYDTLSSIPSQKN